MELSFPLLCFWHVSAAFSRIEEPRSGFSLAFSFSHLEEPRRVAAVGCGLSEEEAECEKKLKGSVCCGISYEWRESGSREVGCNL
ncbi:hypothetical protein M6B38_135165 [Iris pallida]|uniref:Secreted protein n=1 Tax=Iris pallida TaxID=29817 RepID=A0AAX6FG59_IRIPA|nr:hypothetical protein M6B38_135165 [Iris pallida]